MRKLASISSVCEVNPRIPKTLREHQGLPVSFLRMAAVEESGTISSVEERLLGDVLKGYTYFEEGDVLVAKITPCMENGKAAQAVGLPHTVGFGSTEFHVLRPGTEIDGRYLFHMVWNPMFRQAAERRMTGSAGQRRVPSAFFKQFKIPLPPLREQRRIAAILDKADAVRRKRQQTLDLADQFLRSAFLDMFGDPVTNPKGWESREVGTLCQVVRGSSPRPKGDPRYYDGPVPRLMVADITRDGWLVTPRIDSLTEAGARLSRPVPKGTVVMVVSGDVGVVARLQSDACIHDGFVGFLDLDESVVEADYFLLALHFLKATHEQRKAGAIWQNLTTHDIKRISLATPPLPMQTRVHGLLVKYRSLRSGAVTTYTTSGQLFDSLVQRAFRGEL